MLLPGFAAGAEVWAPGVSLSGGWVDNNKSGVKDYWNDDSGMCWAATASSVIQWWQNQNSASLTSTTVPNTPVWDVIRTVYKNVGGNPSTVFDFWINGLKKNEYGVPIEPDSMDFGNQGKDNADWFYGGFLTSVYSTADSPIYIDGSTSGNVYTKAAALVGALTSGYALSIEVGTNDGRASHAITLWGLEYHETSDGLVLDKAYITDSDDSYYGLVAANVDTKVGSGIYLHGMKFENLAYNITRADGMRSVVVVPEPATVTLSLLALTGLLMRRRRK